MAEKRSKKAEEEAKEFKVNEAIRRKAGKVCWFPCIKTMVTNLFAGDRQDKGRYETQGGNEGSGS